MMTDKKWRIPIIFASIILVILLLVNIYFFCFRGAVYSYCRETMGVYMPRFSADEFINHNTFTDSAMFHRFKLNKYETKRIKEDIENNPAWHIYSEDKDNLHELLITNDIQYAISKIDFTGCYIALYDVHNKCFVTETKTEPLCWSFMCAVYDEENSMFYYFEMIW